MPSSTEQGRFEYGYEAGYQYVRWLDESDPRKHFEYRNYGEGTWYSAIGKRTTSVLLANLVQDMGCSEDVVLFIINPQLKGLRT